jgi:glycosyltransferase involved in cell wall biosynthesis
MTRRLLFVTWDGPQVHYLESLFVPILAGLRPHGIESHVLQFRWGSDSLAQEVAENCRRANVGYRAVNVDRRFGAISAFASALNGAREVRASVDEIAPDVIMPRSHMPALAVLAAGSHQFPPLCFDADGLPADERVEFGGLRANGPTYRALTAIECAIVRRSRAVLVRSNYAATILAGRAGVASSRFHVVSNGRDENLFAPGSDEERGATRQQLGVAEDSPLLVYSGSAGGQYRFDLIVAVAVAVRSRHPDARLLILTGSRGNAQLLLSEANPRVMDATVIRSVAPSDVGRYLAAADLALSFRAKSPSMRAVSPIKTAEYLLCGVPVLGTGGIGDTAPAESAGVFRDESIGASAAADWLIDEILPQRDDYRNRARRVGIERFSLARSAGEYLAALEDFAATRG